MSLYWVILSLLACVSVATAALYIRLAIAALRKRSLKVQVGMDADPIAPEDADGHRASAHDDVNSGVPNIARRATGLSPDAQQVVLARVEELRRSEHLDDERDDVHVSLELSMVADDGPPRTSLPARYDNVRIEHSDGRNARLSVSTGRGGTGVDIRLMGAEPSGGLWTADGQRLIAGRVCRIDGGDRLLVELLAESMRFG